MNQHNEPSERRHEVVPAAAGPAVRAYPYAEAPMRYGREHGDDTAEGGLAACWNIIRRRKGSVLIITFLGLLLALLVTLPQTPVYQARTSVEIQSINQD